MGLWGVQAELLRVPLRDWRLCNNGLEVRPGAAECSDYSGLPVSCDSRVIAEWDCLEATLTLSPVAKEALGELDRVWASVDYDRRVRRLHIRWPQPFSEHFTARLDHAMGPRIWWKIAAENTASSRANRSGHVVLERHHHSLDDFFVGLSTVQYPSSAVCDQSAMFVGRALCVHPGFSAVLEAYAQHHQEHPFAVLGIYVSTRNDPRERTSFISGSDCAVANRWTCAFLPSTNCSIPKVLSSCTGSECVQTYPSDTFFPANASGVMIDADRYSLVTRARPTAPFAELVLGLPQGAPYMHRGGIGGAKHHGHYGEDQASNAHMLSFVLRPNAFFRERIRKEMEVFSHTAQFEFGKDRCIAAHMRRGDRLIPADVNRTELCSQDRGSDYGCKSVPFNDVTLEAVWHRARWLAGDEPIHHLIVATDDFAFVSQQLRKMVPLLNEWRVHVVPPPAAISHGHADYATFRGGLGTAGGVHFVSTIRMMQHCEGFVGHEESSVSTLILRAMCLEHYQHQGVCPPAFNLANGL